MKLTRLFAVLRSLPWTLYFNFYYLPFKQAIKLPIILYKPKLLKCNGLVTISGGVKFGMIKLGFNRVSIYPKNGIIWENRGNVIFQGSADIGNDSKISIGPSGILTFGDNFRATTALKCVCYNRVTMDSDVLFGWDCTVSDTDFHTLHVDGIKTRGYGEIHIGPNNWIAMQSLILKDTMTPRDSVIASRSVVSKDFRSEGEKILIAGCPAKVVRQNVYHDKNNDNIIYGCIYNNSQLQDC